MNGYETERQSDGGEEEGGARDGWGEVKREQRAGGNEDGRKKR